MVLEPFLTNVSFPDPDTEDKRPEDDSSDPWGDSEKAKPASDVEMGSETSSQKGK